MKDVPLWMRENQIEKLKSVEDGEFFDLVCPEVHQLIVTWKIFMQKHNIISQTRFVQIHNTPHFFSIIYLHEAL